MILGASCTFELKIKAELRPNPSLLLVHANHDSWHLWSTNDGWENRPRSIVTSKTRFAHATAVVNDQCCNLLQKRES